MASDLRSSSRTSSRSGSPAGASPAPAAQRSSWSVLRALWPFMAPYRARVAVAAIALLVAAAATLVVPLAFRQMIDIGFAVPSQEAPLPAAAGAADVNVWFLALFAVAVVLALGTALRYYSVSWLGERVTA